MEHVRRVVQRIGTALYEYTELIIAAGIAVAITILAALDEVGNQGLTQAAVALLAALAIAIVRERFERRRMSDRIERAVRIAQPGANSWQILDERLVWDLADENGERAVATTEKQYLFTQVEIFSVYEYQYKPVGEVISHECFGGERGGQLDKLPIIREGFPGPEDRLYRLVSLERVWRKGEIMEFRSKRELKDFFRDKREKVSKEVSVPTSRASMCVRWPLTRKPTAIWLERSKRAPQRVDLARLRRDRDRWTLTQTFSNPEVGERIIVRWDW